MGFSIRLFTWLMGQLVGIDSYGNRYYRKAACTSDRHERRWVLYKGLPEASKVPPEWHIWLHYTTDTPLVSVEPQPWQKEHIPNLTGTPNRYLPSGHNGHGSLRTKTTGDYEAWHPE